ncbi:MAG: hypothetical protein WC768_01595 [Patescibacteria group bacterium]|jgi:uncharacterized repeat protein (TIGR01451 family)
MKSNRLKQLKKEADGRDGSSVQKDLMKIYSNQDGSLPDISHLDVRRKSRFKMFFFSFIAVVLILAAISWLGFVIFNQNKNFSGGSIKLELQGQQSIASGDEVVYVLNYKNVENVPLDNVEIIFRYPDNFEFISAQPAPANDFNTAWNLGTLGVGASGQIEIKGKLIGEVGSIKTINATASFQPKNFSSVFKDTASFSSQVTSSILEISLDGPSQILPEKKVTYKITYRNNSSQDLTKVKIVANYPSNFVFQEATPQPTVQAADARSLNNEWLIDTLGKNQEGELSITGGYLNDPQNTKPNFSIQIGFLKPDSDEFSVQQEKSITTEIIQPGLSVDLIINGSNQGQPISFGQTLTYSIVYKNLGDKDLSNVSFAIALDSNILDWSNLDDKHAGLVKDNQITWNKDQISQLDVVKPLDSGTIDFSIKVKDANQVNLSEANLQVKSKSAASIEKIGDLAVTDLKVSSNEIVNNINTDIELKNEGRYFDDDNLAVGTGPLPPVVGQKTTFRIYWSIANSLHEVNNVEVSTKLPDGVNWENKFYVKAGEIKYNSKDRTISWTINKIPANKSFSDLNCWFDISVIPTKKQVRKLLILTDQTTLTATDKTNNSQITKTGQAITSNLEDDQIGGGRGLVIDITE